MMLLTCLTHALIGTSLRRGGSLLILAAACCLTVRAQGPPLQAATPQPASLDMLLNHLSEASDLLQRALPRFECTESVVSRMVHKKKDKQRVDFTATLRVQPSEGPDSGETYAVKTIHGKPTNDPEPLLPIYVRGGFDSVLLTFGRAERACYTFTLAPVAAGTPTRIDFVAVPHAGTMPQCGHAEGLHGFVLLDRNGDPTHIEREVPLALAGKARIAPFAAVDFALVELNGKTYPLSKHLVSYWPHGEDVYDFEATYSGCHEYASTIRILPGSSVIPDTAADTVAKPR